MESGFVSCFVSLLPRVFHCLQLESNKHVSHERLKYISTQIVVVAVVIVAVVAVLVVVLVVVLVAAVFVGCWSCRTVM